MTPPLARGLNGNYPCCHPSDGVRPQPGLDTPLRVYQPDLTSWFGCFSRSTSTSSSGGFWKDFTNRFLFGENTYGYKTGFGLVDLAVTFGVAKLFGIGKNTYNYTSYSGSSYFSSGWRSTVTGDTFTLSNSGYTGPAKISTSTTTTTTSKKTTTTKELTEAEYEKLIKKDKASRTDDEKAQIDAYEKKNKLGKYAESKPKVTEEDYTNAKTPAASEFTRLLKAGAVGVIRNTQLKTLDVSNADGVKNVEIFGDEKGDKGYPKSFSITDISGNKYILTDPQFTTNKLTYKVDLTYTNLGPDNKGEKLNYEINPEYTSKQPNNRLEVKIVDGKIIVENDSGVAIATKND